MRLALPLGERDRRAAESSFEYVFSSGSSTVWPRARRPAQEEQHLAALAAGQHEMAAIGGEKELAVTRMRARTTYRCRASMRAAS